MDRRGPHTQGFQLPPRGLHEAGRAAEQIVRPRYDELMQMIQGSPGLRPTHAVIVGKELEHQSWLLLTEKQQFIIEGNFGIALATVKEDGLGRSMLQDPILGYGLERRNPGTTGDTDDRAIEGRYQETTSGRIAGKAGPDLPGRQQLTDAHIIKDEAEFEVTVAPSLSLK
jgi:hypothetical protein